MGGSGLQGSPRLICSYRAVEELEKGIQRLQWDLDSAFLEDMQRLHALPVLRAASDSTLRGTLLRPREDVLC